MYYLIHLIFLVQYFVLCLFWHFLGLVLDLNSKSFSQMIEIWYDGFLFLIYVWLVGIQTTIANSSFFCQNWSEENLLMVFYKSSLI